MRRYAIAVDGERYELEVQERGGDRFEVRLDGRVLDVRLEDAQGDEAAPAAPEASTTVTLTAPLPGVVASVDVAPGRRVARGERLLTLEAMKMLNPVCAPRDAVVGDVRVTPGQTVAHGDALLTLLG